MPAAGRQLSAWYVRRRTLLFTRSVALAVALCVPAVGSTSELTRVRGELHFDDERQTLTPCGRDSVYWVRVLASNPHFSLYSRVRDLSAEPSGGPIIADLEGKLAPLPSVAPRYRVDRVLYVNRIHSVERGTCE